MSKKMFLNDNGQWEIYKRHGPPRFEFIPQGDGKFPEIKLLPWPDKCEAHWVNLPDCDKYPTVNVMGVTLDDDTDYCFCDNCRILYSELPKKEMKFLYLSGIVR